MLTNVLGGYESFQVVSAVAAGRAVSPIAENDLSSLFASPASGPDVVQWTFSVLTSNPQAIDVVSVDSAPGTDPVDTRATATCSR